MAENDDSLPSRSLNIEGREWIIGLYDAHGSFERFELLPVRAMRLVVASAGLSRLRSHLEEMLTTAIQNSNWEGLRSDPRSPESRLYRVLRSTLVANLENEPAFASAFEIVKQVLPSAPPVSLGEHLQAFGFSAEIDRLGKIRDDEARQRVSWQPGTARVANELTRLGAQENVDPFNPEISDFLLAEDASTTDVEMLFRIASETWKRRLVALNPAPGTSPVAGTPQSRSSGSPGGRPPIALDYETAANTWLEMKAEYKGLKEPRDPSQTDLCDRLSIRGIPIKVRALQSRIQQWRQEGHRWPPEPTD